MNKWFNSSFYFAFWMLLALLPMKYTFNISNQMDHDSRKVIVQMQEQSSMAPSHDEDLYSYEQSESELNGMSDQDFMDALALSEQEYQTSGSPNNPYALSPAQLDFYEASLRENSGLASNSAIDFTTIADEVAVNYEDVATCSAGKNKNRGNIEAVIVKAAKQSSMFADAISERSQESRELPRKCVTHVMNKFGASPKALARCPGGMNTAPQRGGSKPCISKNLVNLTYNHFVDVAECLNIDAKDLLPKLSNESGLLINTLGGGFDAGVGQLTQPAIEEVNKHYDRYLAEVEKAAIKKPACLRVMQYKPYLKKAKDPLAHRCSFIVPPENPMKNIMYMAIYNRMNMDNLLGTKFIAGETFIDNNGQMVALTNTPSDRIVGGKFGNNNIQAKFAQLGITDVNLSNLATMVAFNGYNTGPSTAFNMLNEYLDKRISAKRTLTERDFDFHNPKTATDIDGKTKSVTEIARLFVRSAFIKKNDPDAKIKVKRAKLLPEKIRKSHLLTFPEFLVYNQNNFDSSILNPKNLAQKDHSKFERFAVIGAPGYLSFLASKDTALRTAFENSGADKYYCSNPNFLKIRDYKAKPMAAVAVAADDDEPAPAVKAKAPAKPEAAPRKATTSKK